MGWPGRGRYPGAATPQTPRLKSWGSPAPQKTPHARGLPPSSPHHKFRPQAPFAGAASLRPSLGPPAIEAAAAPAAGARAANAAAASVGRHGAGRRGSRGPGGPRAPGRSPSCAVGRVALAIKHPSLRPPREPEGEGWGQSFYKVGPPGPGEGMFCWCSWLPGAAGRVASTPSLCLGLK